MHHHRHRGLLRRGHARGRQGKAVRPKKLALLALLLETHPSLVRADLQRYYGLNIEHIGVEFSAFHAAECLSCLPHGALSIAAIEPSTAYGYVEHMLHAIMSAMAGKELPYPWDECKTGIEGIETESVPLDEFKDWYENTSWEEVDSWQVR